MKWILAIIVNLAFILLLVQLHQYNFISYILGAIQMGIYLIIVNYIDD